MRSNSPGRVAVAAREELRQRPREDHPEHGDDGERDERHAANAREEALRRVVPFLARASRDSTGTTALETAPSPRSWRSAFGIVNATHHASVASRSKTRREHHVAREPEHARRERPRADDARARRRAALSALLRCALLADRRRPRGHALHAAASRRRSARPARVALAERAQVLERVDAARVPVEPLDARARSRRPARCPRARAASSLVSRNRIVARVPLAARARAVAAQDVVRVDALVPVGPVDLGRARAARRPNGDGLEGADLWLTQDPLSAESTSSLEARVRRHRAVDEAQHRLGAGVGRRPVAPPPERARAPRRARRARARSTRPPHARHTRPPRAGSTHAACPSGHRRDRRRRTARARARSRRPRASRGRRARARARGTGRPAASSAIERARRGRASPPARACAAERGAAPSAAPRPPRRARRGRRPRRRAGRTMRASLSVVSSRALVLEQHGDGVHRLERAADAARALARPANDGRRPSRPAR